MRTGRQPRWWRRSSVRVGAGVLAAAALAAGCGSTDDTAPGPDDAVDASSDAAVTSPPPTGGDQAGVPTDPEEDPVTDDAIDEAALLDAATVHLEGLGLDVAEFELEVRGARPDGTVEVRALHAGDVPEEGTLGGGSGESRALHLDPASLEVVADLRFQ